jgi:hypothetical protein
MGSRILALSGAGSDHENTTTEGSIARKIFAAGELLAGKVYRFSCPVVVSDNNSTDTLTLAVRWGSSSTVTSNTAVYTSGAVNSEDADVSWIQGEIHVVSATQAVICILGSDPDATGTIAPKAGVSVQTIAATTAYYLDITADWSVASEDNEVACASLFVEELA